MATTEHHPLVLQLFFHAILLFPHFCSAQTDSCPVIIQVDCSGAGRDGSGGNQYYTFTDLGTALNSSEFQSSNNTVCIDLTPGEHVLEYSRRVIGRDVVISGGGPQEVIVVCHNASEENLSESGYDQFPLRFGNESRVMVRGVRFEGCARPLLFYEAQNVTLEDCSFSSFTQSAVEIYNTPYVTISNCSFTNNTSLGIGTIKYSGNAGALSIGFSTTFSNITQPEILIQDSVFDGNEANVSGECVQENTILSTNIYTQRGGGVAGYFGAAGLEINLLVERCSFVNNRAQDSGGGLYINLSGVKGAVNNVTVRESNFSGNYATMDGGGLEVTFDTATSVHFPSFLLVQDCHFSYNRAKYGGAFKPVQISSQGNLNRIHIERSMFQQNRAEGGAVLHMQSLYAGVGLARHTEQNTSRIAIEDCTFTENTGVRSIVFISNNQVRFTGINQFIGNTGSSIRVSGTLLSLSGRLQFIENQNHDDGPSGILYVTSFAQVLLNPGVSVSFINNNGSEGGAIVVKSSRVSSGFAQTLYNPQCFLQFSESQVAPIEWANYNVSLVFRGNRAIFAPVMYISSLDACSWFNNSGLYFNTNITETWSFMSAEQNYILGSESPTYPPADPLTDPLTDRPELYIQTDVNDLRIDIPLQSSAQCQGKNNTDDNMEVCAYPGQDIQLKITALDQLSQITYGFVQITTQNTSIEFIPTIVHATASGDLVSFRYNSSETFGTVDVKLETPFSVTEVSRIFTLSYIGCPPGFNLSMDRYQCECESEKRPEVLSCDPNKEFVLLHEGLWGAPPSWSRSLVTYRCPSSYCNCSGIPGERSIEGCILNFTNPSLSCHHNRTGVLCGECRESYGVGMLTMECRKFTASFNMYYWLLPLLVLFIVVVVVVVVKVGVAIPALLLGPLFYIQVAPIGVSQLNDSFKLYPAIMDCIESTLALYVPYDFSLHQELTALESYGLRYISPLLTLVVVPIAMRIKYHTRSWYGVWTLLLLMYAIAVETSASLLFCPTLINGSNQSITVWFFDGSVRCYSGGHLGLTILAVIFLVVGVLFIAPVAVIAYQKEISKKLAFLDRRHFEMISLAFTHHYKDIHRWWAPFELVRRYVFTIAVIFTPGYLTVSLSLASGMMAIQWFIQPYKDRMANIAEALCLSILVVVLCIGDTNDIVSLAMGHYFHLWPVFYLPVVVGFVCICVVIGKGIWKASKSFKAWWNERRKLKKREYRDVPSSVSYHSDPNVAVDGTYRTLTTIVSIHEFEDD